MNEPAARDGAYAALEALFAKRHHLGEALGVLGWDRQVMMPDGASSARAETMAALTGFSHELLTAPETADLLAAAEDDASLGEDPALEPWRRANLREMRRAHAHASAVPRDLVTALSIAEAEAEMAWRAARAADDFLALLPSLTKVLELTQEAAAAKSAAFGLAPYDALLDQYEPGARAESIDALFAALSDFLPAFTETALARQAARPAPPAPAGPFPVATQKALAETLMRAIGFDAKRGRLDVSLHPFCGGADDDVRITTRYDEDDFASALMGVLHETGHALYEQGLPDDWRRSQPVGSSRGMALHESQSLFIEMQVCRSAAFLSFAAPQFRDAFGAEAGDPAWSAEAFTARAQRVERGFIRVDADEVTYPAHVILRYRLERAMIGGALSLEDLPGAWSDGMRAALGVTPPNDRLGCLQDIHWPSGAFGYFPTYTLGAMAAAQLAEAARAATPDWDERLAAGDFSALLSWLRTHVHSRASLLDSEAILTEATGAPLQAAPFLRHLEARYGEAA
ncbi:MAG: carboxypeptidase M32 [Pseudomonadota bacterium]